MKNFSTVEVGHWYKNASGNLILITEANRYDYYSSGRSTNRVELVAEIEPPQIKPLPMPKKKLKKTLDMFAPRHAIDAINNGNIEGFLVKKKARGNFNVPVSLTVEFEE